MSPLASVMLLAFLFVIVLALVAWALLQPRAPPRATPERDDARAPTLDVSVTNDDVRGAKASPKRPQLPDDAFERFLRAGRDDDRA